MPTASALTVGKSARPGSSITGFAPQDNTSVNNPKMTLPSTQKILKSLD